MGNPVRDYRSKHGLTLKAFAEMVGVKKSAIWKYENGIVPSVQTAMAIDTATRGEVSRQTLRPDVWDAPAVPAAEVA